jgi:hypothetical protein
MQQHLAAPTNVPSSPSSSPPSSSSSFAAVAAVPFSLSAASSSSSDALAHRFGIDLQSLVSLREAAGGSVRSALAYLQQVVPRGAVASRAFHNHALSSGEAIGVLGENPAGNLIVPFDPFGSMQELIQTVRGMRERDQIARLPTPVWEPPRIGSGGTAPTMASAQHGNSNNSNASAASWLYGRRDKQYEPTQQFADAYSPSAPYSSQAPPPPLRSNPAAWRAPTAEQAASQARAQERAARIAAQELLHFTPAAQQQEATA